MGRGRVQLRKIENKIYRQVTFSKRRNGLKKKASELSILCDAEVALIVFSNRGKLYDFASSSMAKILERYRTCSNSGRNTARFTQDSNMEFTQLKEKVETLQRCSRHLLGEDLDRLTIRELQQLEQQLDGGLHQVISKKNQIMFDMIEDLQRKEQLLEEANKSLQKTLSEVEGQYTCDQYAIQISCSSTHRTLGDYNPHVQSPHREPTRHIGCPSAPIGITTGRRTSGTYGADGWMF